MADSDEETERHRSRDKFRRERSDYDNRRRPGDKREPFDDRTGTLGGGYNRSDHRATDVRSMGTDRGRSPAAEPPPYKRSRRDDDYRSAASKRRDLKNVGNLEDDSMYRPPLVPFKRFLEPLDDLISEEEACNKYREYKESYSKRHIEEFFEAHKNEEWFRLRYHPDYMPGRKEEAKASLKHRLQVFMELYEKGFFANQSVQMDNSENLIRLMDTVVIKLEGGSDDDLKVLDTVEQDRYPDEVQSRQRNTSISSNQASGQMQSGHKSEEGEAESDLDADDSDKDSKVMNPSGGLNESHGRDGSRDSLPSKRSRHSRSSRSCSIHSSEDDNEVAGDLVQPVSDKNAVTNGTTSLSGDDGQKEPRESQKRRKSGSSNASPTNEDDETDVPTPTTAENPEGIHVSNDGLDSVSSVLLGSADEKALSASVNAAGNQPTSQPDEVASAANRKRSWPLHKTASIFFRALPPSVTEAELKELCASQPGFLRLAMWDPVPERRFTRHAWATYKPTVNIKKVCWALNTSPLLREKVTLPNGELGATVNRDLAQRVRPLTPLTRHKPVMRHDLMLAAQLVARLDDAHSLWEGESETLDTEQVTEASDATQTKFKSVPPLLSLAIRSKNPLLKNLTDYLVEEGGSEEEALLAESSQPEPDESGDGSHTGRPNPVVLEYDPALAKALDHLILYLRVVHSVDFYAGAVYPNEDSMPHRCGILHARGDRGLNPTLPGGRSAGLVFSQKEIADHIRNFELKLCGLIDVPKDLTEDEMKKLGMRDPEKAAEEFIEANIQKRTGKKKPFKVVWVCPLSDKKFREPIFVRKHIFNKHMEKVEAAKKDNAIFFNNYLRDPRRPTLPEAPYHIAQQYFGSANVGSYRGNRSGRGPGGNYRGNYRAANSNNPLLPNPVSNYGRSGGAFQDYYDVAAQQQQQQAMAAVAAAAAAALYPNTATAADLYALAAGGGGARSTGAPGMRRGQRGNSPGDFNSRSYHNDGRRKQNSAFGNNSRRPFRTMERGVISYNDLDDPNNEGV